MSRVTFKTAVHEVIAGWDRPLQEFFLTVFELDNEDWPVWSTLDEPSMFDKETTDHLQVVLEADLQVEAPEGFWERVNAREGNVQHVFKNGEWRKYE